MSKYNNSHGSITRTVLFLSVPLILILTVFMFIRAFPSHEPIVLDQRIPSPSPNEEIEAWQERDELIRSGDSYTFEYPENWIIVESGSRPQAYTLSLLPLKNTHNENTNANIEIQVAETIKSDVTYDEILPLICPSPDVCGNREHTKQITVNNTPAVELTNIALSSRWIVLIDNNNQNVYQFILRNEGAEDGISADLRNEIFNHILETFQLPNNTANASVINSGI